jgi:hypothetical protein
VLRQMKPILGITDKVAGLSMRTNFSFFYSIGNLLKIITFYFHFSPFFLLQKYKLAARYFTGLLPACRTPEDFDRIVAELIREGIKPTEDTLSALIAGCHANGGLSQALAMFKELRLFSEAAAQQRGAAEEAEERRTLVPKPSLGASIFF